MRPLQNTGRDTRVDVMRGVALLSIFVDHIPANQLANFTLHNFGFSDAAELFVILAGFASAIAYGRVFERDGLAAGIRKVLARCLTIYGVQAALLIATLIVVTLWTHHYGREALIVGPMLRDGLHGAARGLMLEALPSYLDILPLYIVLLAVFPLIWLALRWSVLGTLAASVVLYGVANVTHLDLPNVVDPAAATTWYFNPFTWQVIFVLGAVISIWIRTPVAIFAQPSGLLRGLCWVYLAFAFVALDAWHFWPPVFGNPFPMGLFGNDPKSFVSPWRLVHMLAIIYLALTSPGFARVAGATVLRPFAACGRHSLPVFGAGCALALIGRLLFRTLGTDWVMQVAVNGVGLCAMVALGLMLDREARVRTVEVTRDAPAVPSLRRS